ncbi:MAG: hypothetical protein A2Y96_02710 [Firmicutes bacterium RBG_13_65_8]|nr:MAG: hypothetical protein A2Y96_02710 [Firmicutes bacterium RBG_13_65_8]
MVLVAAVLGLMLSLGFRFQRALPSTLQNRRWDELAVLLQQCENERDSLRGEVVALRAAVAEAGQGSEQARVLSEELRNLRLVSGFGPGAGPGLQVTLDDSQRTSQGGEDPNLFLLHDDDVLRVVNELAAAGAEAISINGQRHIATTEIRCAGPAISINNTRVAPPIRVVAVGDPATLESSLRMRGGVLEILTALGIQVRIEQVQAIEVPAFTGTLRLRYLQAVQ